MGCHRLTAYYVVRAPGSKTIVPLTSAARPTNCWALVSDHVCCSIIIDLPYRRDLDALLLCTYYNNTFSLCLEDFCTNGSLSLSRKSDHLLECKSIGKITRPNH